MTIEFPLHMSKHHENERAGSSETLLLKPLHTRRHIPEDMILIFTTT